MKKVPAWIVLCVICLVAGLALGFTNELTQKPIDEQAKAAAAEARKTVMADAVEFEELTVDSSEGGEAKILSCYAAKNADGDIIGKVVTAVITGYKGEIEVVVGVDAEGNIKGISCGGTNFNETAGLGAKVRDTEFTDQFSGRMAPVQLVKFGGDIDSVTQASISSNAVCQAVNAVAEYALGN